ncbi:MAG TPA: M14 family zinc carboxypeptidase [Gemmatimonadaceae bacterium]|nr:M14 family zinc carboxypeptidase [Gemmatimonadaceae bacterium]
MSSYTAPRLTWCLAALAICLAAPAIEAQDPGARDSIGRDDRNFSFYARGPYRRHVPQPEQILGYDVGEWNTQFHLQERVLLGIAEAATDRVRVEEIGTTNERRPMRLFLVSAPENIQRLDSIRADLLRLASTDRLSAAERDALIERTPAVVWINESVHGNEAPGFEAAMQTLYHLAATEDPATLEALRNVLVVLNPSTNPDGHERFAVWYNSVHTRTPYTASLEKQEPWSVQGRFNHYRFDMNRDVMTTTQQEVRNLVRAMHRWHPMVAVDQHGQTSNYFFPPTAAPLNANFDATFERWMETYGRGNAEAFDRNGWMYYSRDYFDLYGPFYWDSWPSLTGAIGMTYETDCGGWKGILWRREDGSLCSFRDGIAKHYTTALATIETTGARRRERVRDWVQFRANAVHAGRTGTMKRVVLDPSRDPRRAAELAATLLRSGIVVRRTTAPFTASRAHAYADDAVGSRRFEAGAYVIDLAQPMGIAAKAVLEPAPAMDTAFVRKQLEKLGRNLRRGESESREGYEFYDVTAWALPVTFGVDAYWTEDAAAVSGEPLSFAAADPGMPEGVEQVLAGDRPLVAAAPSGISGGRARSAYVFASGTNGSVRLAYQLLNEGYRVAASSLPLEAAGRQWPRGTFVVRPARNAETLHDRLDALAKESGVEVTAVSSAFTGAGQYGVGSEAMVDLTAPKVALVGDEGISQTSYGAVWWSLERRYGMRITPVTTRWLGNGRLGDFNVIVIPDASSGTLSRIVGKGGADRLRTWMQQGGTLITMSGATAWAATADVNFTSARAVGAAEGPDAEKGAASDSTASAEVDTSKEANDRLAVTSPSADPDTPEAIPGAHFDVVLDRTHWLTHGYERPRTTVMQEGGTFFRLSKQGSNVGVFAPTGKLTRAGFVWPGNTERLLRNTAFLIEESVGGGHLVAFANEPMFRGWWRALDQLVLNAIVLGPAF